MQIESFQIESLTIPISSRPILKKIILMWIIQLKMVNLYQKEIKFDQKWLKTTGFWIIFNIFDQLRSIFDIN